jgi:2,6-dihydroxypseudooxynicotine hydrolase
LSETLTETDDAVILRSVWAAAEIRVVGDGVFYPDLLRMRESISRWPDWLPAWSELGREYEELAAQALEDGHLVTAGEHYWQAALCWHFAQFLWFHRPEEKEPAQHRKVELYRKAAPLLQPPAERVQVEFDGIAMPGFLRLPAGVRNAPCAILIGGLDSTKEESYHFENACLRRGLATFAFDGPGQGECYFQRPLVPDFERYTSAVVDYLQTRPELDGDRIGVLGRSLGGYYAARSAAVEPRLRACAIFGALTSLAHFDSMPPQTQLGFRYVTGLEDPGAARERAREYVELGDLGARITQPLFVLHGALDVLIPDSQARDLAAAARSEDKRLWIDPDGIHCSHNRYHLVRRPMADWLASRLKASPGEAVGD